LLSRLLVISHRSLAAELLKRSSAVLPVATGSPLLRQARLAVVEATQAALDWFEGESAGVPESLRARLSQRLRSDLLAARLQLFESALETDHVDEAFAAIVTVIEIEAELLGENGDDLIAGSMDVSSSSPSSGPQKWRQCLAALVLHACDSGNLGFLCSLPDTWVGTVHLSAAVADELDRLATGSGVLEERLAGYYRATDNANQPTCETMEHSRYECLLVYQLHHSKFRQASVVMQSHASRLASQDVYAEQAHTGLQR
jgi:hypothetical protein